jgi:hypothetical protein
MKGMTAVARLGHVKYTWHQNMASRIVSERARGGDQSTYSQNQALPTGVFAKKPFGISRIGAPA